jgi:5-oxoprolinase (ATP-hydrolysing) subunit B
VQLRPDPLETAVMMQQVLSLRGEATSSPDSGCAWTGDLNGVWQVHRLPAFEWLRRQVESQAWAYLEALGFDIGRLALFIQRCWPVVSEAGMVVGRHHHPNAHLSAVFYLNGDGSGRGGVLRLYTPRQVNELVPGLGVGHDGPIAADHPLNAPWLDLAPEAGLLVLFPASTDHAVTENQDGENVRLSISFDLVLCALPSSDPLGSAPEYLAPHPDHWTPVPPRPS